MYKMIGHASLCILLILSLLSLTNADPFWKVFCDRQPIFRGRADPIVTPGKLSGHSHRVFGANNFDLGDATYSPIQEYNRMAASTCTTCSISIDKTAYWVPDLYYQWPNGTFSLVPDAGLTVYYPSRSGSGAQASPKWRAFPPGLRMLAGTPTRRVYNASDLTHQAISYACIGVNGPETPAFPADVSACVDGLRAQIWFPMCWDGVNLDSADHKSHMSYPIEAVNFGNCPDSHPVRVPGVFFEVLFSITSFPRQSNNPFTWSCGDQTGYGYHGDFLSGWNEQLLQSAILDPSCDATNTNNGNNVAACNTFAPYLENLNNCTMSTRIPILEDLGYNHPITQLPGCNPITTATVTSGVCSTTPEPQTGNGFMRFLLQHKSTNTLYVGARTVNDYLTSSVTVPTYTEVWTAKTIGPNQQSIQSDSTGQFLTSPLGSSLICNRNSASAWEIFTITAAASAPGYYTILANSNNMYVSLHSDGTLHGDSATISDATLWKLINPLTLSSSTPAPPSGTPPPPPPPAPVPVPVVSTPTPVSSGGCALEPNTDFYGDDITSGAASSTDQCCSFCKSVSGCVAWTLAYGTCYAKSGRGSVNANAQNIVSGTVASGSTPPPQSPPPSQGTCTSHANTDYYGNDIGNKAVSSANDCCNYCATVPGCKAWTFASGTCYVKSAAGSPSTNNGLVSGTLNSAAFADFNADNNGEFFADNFYDSAVAADATTQPTQTTTPTTTTETSGLAAWVVALFVMFSIVLVFLIVVIVQVALILRR